MKKVISEHKMFLWNKAFLVDSNYELWEFQGEYIEFNRVLQLSICDYEEVYTDFKNNIKSYHSIKNSSFVKHFAK